MHLAGTALSSASLQNVNWQEADQLAIYKAWSGIWTWGYWQTNPSRRVEVLNPGPPDYNTSVLNHSAMRAFVKPTSSTNSETMA